MSIWLLPHGISFKDLAQIKDLELLKDMRLMSSRFMEVKTDAISRYCRVTSFKAEPKEIIC